MHVRDTIMNQFAACVFRCLSIILHTHFEMNGVDKIIHTPATIPIMFLSQCCINGLVRVAFYNHRSGVRLKYLGAEVLSSRSIINAQ